MDAATLLAAANHERPEMISKTASVMAMLERHDPYSYGELRDEVDAILNHTQEKVASADWNRFGMAMGGTLAAGLGASVATDLYDAAKRGLTKSLNYRRLMEANPDLAEKAKHDQRLMRTAFNAVHRFAPEFTSDPLVGGNVVRNVFEAPEMAQTVIKDMLSNRKNLREAKAKQFSPGHVYLEPKDTRHADAIDLANRRSEHEFKIEAERSRLQGANSRALEADKWRLSQNTRENEHRRSMAARNVSILNGLKKNEEGGDWNEGRRGKRS